MQNYKITFIIGPARAGTTFLAQSLLSQDIEYFEEPNIVWKHRNFHHKFEELDSSNVNKKIKDYIRNYFFSRAKKNGKQMSLLFPFLFYSEQLLLFHQPSFIHHIHLPWTIICSKCT